MIVQSMMLLKDLLAIGRVAREIAHFMVPGKVTHQFGIINAMFTAHNALGSILVGSGKMIHYLLPVNKI